MCSLYTFEYAMAFDLMRDIILLDNFKRYLKFIFYRLLICLNRLQMLGKIGFLV